MWKPWRVADDEPMLRSIANTKPSPQTCAKCGAGVSVISIARDNGFYRLTACSPCGDRLWTCDGQPVDSEDAISGLG